MKQPNFREAFIWQCRNNRIFHLVMILLTVPITLLFLPILILSIPMFLVTGEHFINWYFKTFQNYLDIIF